jgi:hypothetical protein
VPRPADGACSFSDLSHSSRLPSPARVERERRDPGEGAAGAARGRGVRAGQSKADGVGLRGRPGTSDIVSNTWNSNGLVNP